MAVSGEFLWPSAGIFVAAVVEVFMAADILRGQTRRDCRSSISSRCLSYRSRRTAEASDLWTPRALREP